MSDNKASFRQTYRIDDGGHVTILVESVALLDEDTLKRLALICSDVQKLVDDLNGVAEADE